MEAKVAAEPPQTKGSASLAKEDFSGIVVLDRLILFDEGGQVGWGKITNERCRTIIDGHQPARDSIAVLCC